MRQKFKTSRNSRRPIIKENDIINGIINENGTDIKIASGLELINHPKKAQKGAAPSLVKIK